MYAITAGSAVPGTTTDQPPHKESKETIEAVQADLSEVVCRMDRLELQAKRAEFNEHEALTSIRTRSDVIELMISQLRG